MNKLNCAVYVRKSTEKGLEQAFNSLQNQEEACRSYILSQTFNGWEYYKTYTDGGISGGTMKRPALMEMLEDMKKGLIQVVVCYKVDRLSRSIIDFHNMMKELEKHNCNFVSITQAFDTSTSMGKLTLNMLLSFAQFEREVSSERVRDKIHASKEKGLWTGGPPPLGYDIVNKQLVPNPREAAQVRCIFEKYLEVGSITCLREYLVTTGIRGKRWLTQQGSERGGGILAPSMLARILRSQVYIGKVENKVTGISYPGKHKPIIDTKLFDRVQALMDDNLNKETATYDTRGYLLSGKLVDAQGHVFKNQKSSKGGVKKYRYYALRGQYLPAGDFEDLAYGVVQGLLNHPLHTLLDKAQTFAFKSVDIDSFPVYEQARLVRAMVERIIYHENTLTFMIPLNDISYLQSFMRENYQNTSATPLDAQVYVSADGRYLLVDKEVCINPYPTTTTYVGKGKKIISIRENCTNLIKALSIGWRYGRMADEGIPLKKIKTLEHKGDRSIYRYLSLNYLSPTIVNAIMESLVPAHVNLQLLFTIAGKYPDFTDQEKVFFTGS